MDAADNHLAPGEEGEIVIRGPNVTPGYENNEAANREAFTGGWFRTGDQGFRDGDEYFTITGRLKEIINRGGEKISPREVDEVLMDHPAVQQVVTFAMPHPKLGEEVAAAVVLRDGAEAAPGEVRAFAAERLAGFKVPRARWCDPGRDPEGADREAAQDRAGGAAGGPWMKVAIYGAGATGGYLGVKLALAGVDTTLIARGAAP